jgi:hypothetical protein
MALAGELGSRPLVARCHLGLGQLHRRAAPAAAREHLTSAIALLREMRMPYWLAEAELAAQG